MAIKCDTNSPQFAALMSRGATVKEIAAAYGLSNSAALRAKQRYKATTAHIDNSAGDDWTLPGARVSTPQPVAKAPAHGGRWKRFVVASDVHGDKSDPDANRVLFDFTERDWKPTIRICAGDVFDFRPLRRGASQEEKSESMAGDYRAGLEWMERFYAGHAEQKHLCLGNHDARLFELAEYGKGVEKDFAMDKANHVNDELARLGVNVLPYHKRHGILQIGHLKVLHGFHCGIYASRQTALVYGSALFGHTHSIDEHHIAGLERRAARNIGCLCQLDMDYNSRMPNSLKQAHGFAFGVIHEHSGLYQCWQAEEIEGAWIMPSDVVEKS